VDNHRVVIITGGAGGIGSKIVDRFVRNGDLVIVIDRDVKALEHLQQSRNAGAQLTTLTGDIAEENDVRRFGEEIRSSAGRVDVLVNCAGYYPVVPFEQMTFENWREVVAINLSGAFS